LETVFDSAFPGTFTTFVGLCVFLVVECVYVAASQVARLRFSCSCRVVVAELGPFSAVFW